MQTNQWKIVRDHLPTKSRTELYRITLMWSELDDQRHKGDAHHDYRGRIKSKRCKNRHLHWVYMSDMQTLLASSCSPDCMCTPCLHLHPEPSQLPAKRSHAKQFSHQKFHQKPKKLSLHYYFKNHKFCVFHINTQNFHPHTLSLSLSPYHLKLKSIYGGNRHRQSGRNKLYQDWGMATSHDLSYPLQHKVNRYSVLSSEISPHIQKTEHAVLL